MLFNLIFIQQWYILFYPNFKRIFIGAFYTSSVSFPQKIPSHFFKRFPPAQRTFLATFTPVFTVPPATATQLFKTFPQIELRVFRGFFGSKTHSPSFAGSIQIFPSSFPMCITSSTAPVVKEIASLVRSFAASTPVLAIFFPREARLSTAFVG